MLVLGSAICRYGGVCSAGIAFLCDRFDEEGFRRDLERTVSDDTILWTYLHEIHTDM